MNNIVVRFNKPILVRESKESKEEVQQERIDELLPGPAFLTHSYKWLGPVHDMINMADSKTKGIFKNFFEWYQDNDTVQTVGQAFTTLEDNMNEMWEDGAIGKSQAIAMQSLMGLGDVTGASVSSTVGGFLAWVRDGMEKKKIAAAKVAMEKIAKSEEEASAKVENEELKRTIRRMEMENAKRLFYLAKKLKKEIRKTDDEKGERMTPISQTQQNDAYVNEDKKMTKKYSSFKDQHRITENFRRFINEEEIKKTLSEAGEIPPKPDWMSQERYDQLVRPEIARRTKDDEEASISGLTKAGELKLAFLEDIGKDLGAKAVARTDGLWVGLPSEKDPEIMSKNGLATRDRLNSKFIESDWHADKFDKKGWVKVTKISEPRDTWTDPDPHGRYVPGEKAPRLSPWEE